MNAVTFYVNEYAGLPLDGICGTIWLTAMVSLRGKPRTGFPLLHIGREPSEERDGSWYMNVKEIEKAIVQLSAEELAELVDWIENYHAQLWDKQIEEDLEAGRLDALLAEVDQEYRAGLSQPL